MHPWQLADNADNAVVDKGRLKAGVRVIAPQGACFWPKTDMSLYDAHISY